MWAHPERQAGMALMLVLWVLVLLSVIAGEFCYATRTEVNTVRNFKEETEAYYIAQAGLYRAIQGLLIEELRTAAAEVVEVKEAPGEEAEEAIRWRVNAPIPPVAFGAGRFTVKIDNESGKVDLNNAGPDMLRMLLGGFDLEEHEKDVIVDSILDWRDEDDLHRLNGAEDDYYSNLDNPYPCKDGPFEAVDELLLVRGVTAEIFYGGLRDMVTVNRQAYDGGAEAVFGRLVRVKRSAAGKVNINAASPSMLKVLPGMTEELAAKVVEYRQVRDIEASSELAAIVGPEAYAALSHYVTYRNTPYYTIRAVGTVDRVRRGIEVMVRIDRRLKEGYRILSWTDALAHTEITRAPARGLEKES